jgi:protocatechuate 4,5-dioxygenase, alpha chain
MIQARTSRHEGLTATMWTRHDYDDIPGTYVFDGRHAHESYALNKLLFSLNSATNRAALERDPGGYCDRYGVSGRLKTLLLEQDFLGMLRAGANIYYLAKMAIPRGTSVQDAGASFQGITTPQFQAKLRAQAQGLQEQLTRRQGYWNG